MDGERDRVQVRMHAVVRGRVQGVNFRRFIAEHARRLRLRGGVRNGTDGQSVEIVAEGARAELERLLALARYGPRFAQVERVDTAWSEPEGEAPGFRVLG